MKSLEKNIKKGLVFLIALFVLLAVYFSYVLFIYSDRWFANTYNPRVRMDSWSPKVIPGDIKDRKGKVLATTIKERRNNPDTAEKQIFYYRNYMNGGEKARSIAHVVGFNDYKYGRSGVEALQVRYLMGYNNPFYERVYQKVFLPVEVGNTLFLTIDEDLQAFVDDLLGEYKGSIVVMDSETGEILAMVSHPTFNPNKLEEEIKGDVLVSRATDGLYTPGSIFKIIAASALLDESNPEDLEENIEKSFNCEGTVTIDSIDISCYQGDAHGEVGLEEALIHSCNGYFSMLGTQLGKTKLLKAGEKFGFNEDFIFPDLRMSSSKLPLKGNIPKEKLALTSIGQGDVLVTPLHMAMIASAVANDGLMMEPKLIFKVENRNGKIQKEIKPKTYRKVMDPNNAKIMQDMLKDAVLYGTGNRASVKGREVAGKTGTAEVIKGEDEMANNAWFIGYVSGNASKISISVVLEDVPSSKTGGNSAAPLAGRALGKAVELGY